MNDLNKHPDVVKRVNQGDYDAQLYIDHAGDGWVKVQCEALVPSIPQSLAAYSILAPPDLFPAVKQQDVFDWWQQSSPPEVRKTLFPDFQRSLPTEPLSDARITANISFRKPITSVSSDPIFVSDDDTYTAIVSNPGSGSDQLTQMQLDIFDDQRVSPLPDGASGLFAPGWDVSRSQLDDEKSPSGVLHLSGFGGSIPFLEDARMCAAMSAFWPAVAPDASRLYEPGRFPSVTPIPDRLLGWDGLAAPEIIRKMTSGKPGLARFHGLGYTDYVAQALATGFDFKKIGEVSVSQYELWTLLMARIYQALNAAATLEKTRWAVVNFDHAKDHDSDLIEARSKTKLELKHCYRFYLIRPIGREPQGNPRVVDISFDRSVLAFATPMTIAFLDTNNGKWVGRVF